MSDYRIGDLFKLDSGLGGSYTAKFIGRQQDGDQRLLRLQVVNPGHEHIRLMPEEKAEEQLEKI